MAEVGEAYGCNKALLIQRAADIDAAWLDGVATLGLTAGASAPEVLVEEVIDAIAESFDVTVEEVRITEENVIFKVPKVLAA